MRRINIRNPDLSGVEKSFFTSDYTSGVSQDVLNNFAFSANDLVVIGQPLTENTEIAKISSLNGNQGLIFDSALKFSHPKDTPIRECPWNFVIIEGNLSNGWEILSQTGLQFDKQYSIYEHSAGTSNWSYRWRFFNSVTGTYSEYSPTFKGSGFTKDQVGYMLQNVRKVTNTSADVKVIRDFEIVRAFNAAQDIAYGMRQDWWFLKRKDTSIAAEADKFLYNLDYLYGGTPLNPGILVGKIDRIKMHFVVGTTEDRTYKLTFRTEEEFDYQTEDNLAPTEDRTVDYTIRPADSQSINGYIEVAPTPKTDGVGNFEIDFFEKFPLLESDVDKTPMPIPGILENFAISFINRIRGNSNEAEYYEELFYGPPDTSVKSRRLTGLKLLEQLQSKNMPSSRPKSLMYFRGQKGAAKMQGSRYRNADYRNQTYWN